MRRLLLAFLSVVLTSTVLLASPAAAVAPGVPGNVVATLNGIDAVDVTWDTPTEDPLFPVTGYTVSLTGQPVQAIPVGTNTASFGGLLPGTSYTASVVATNDEPLSSAPGESAPVTTPTAPGAPTGVLATPGTTTIDVSWVAPASDGGSAITDYTVTATGPGGPFDIASVGAATSAQLTGLSESSTYSITVTATNAVGTGLASAAIESTTSASAAVPDAPAAPTASLSSSNQLLVEWNEPAANGSAIIRYDVRLDGGAPVPVTGTSTTFTVQRPSSAHTATVVAVNGVGSSVESQPSNAVDVPIVVPSAPAFTAAVVTGSKTSATVSWTPPADPGDDVVGLTGYSVVVLTAAGSPFERPATDREFTVTGLTPGQSYTFRVRARNSLGVSAIVEADDVTIAMPGLEVPGAPGDVTASIDIDDVTVTWTAPTTGDAVTSYEITLSNDGGSTTVGAAAPTSVTFQDVPAGTYTATVQAIGQAGAGGSATSNAVTVPDVPGPPTEVSASLLGIDGLTVTWVAPADTGGIPLTGFEITINPGVGQALPDAEPGDTSYEISGLLPATNYTVTVRARNAIGAGEGTSSNAVRIPTTPGAVTDVTVAQLPMFTGTATVTWAAPADTGGSTVIEYRVALDGVTQTIPGGTTTATFAGVPVGVHTATVQPITLINGPVSTSPPFEVRAFAPFDSETEFIRQLYADFLRRSPDAAGVAYWESITADDGSNIEEIVTAFMNSPEFAPRRAVARLFLAYFNRLPDKGGFDYWTKLLATRQISLQVVSDTFAASPEFNLTYGSLSNAEFIVLVYNNVFNGRRPDYGGYVYWLDLLDRGVLSRGEMMTQFSESAEFVGQSRPAVDVTVTYDGMLQRQADVDGFKFWRDLISNDVNSLRTLIRAFYESDEYALRVDG